MPQPEGELKRTSIDFTVLLDQSTPDGIGEIQKKKVPATRRMEQKSLPTRPSIRLLSGKRLYRLKERAIFKVMAKEDDDIKVICIVNNRETICPGHTRLQKQKLSDGQLKIIVRLLKAGIYKLKVNNILSDKFEVKEAVSGVGFKPPGMRAATKEKLSGNLKMYPAPTIISPKPGQKFSFGKMITLKIKSNSKYKGVKLQYALYKNKKCSGTPYKKSSSPRFSGLAAGNYCISAVYKGGTKDNWSKGISFVLLPKPKLQSGGGSSAGENVGSSANRESSSGSAGDNIRRSGINRSRAR